MKLQRGGFAIGIVIGLLVGLAAALAVALYITKAPIPFIDKVPQRTVEQDQAEAEKNRNWDPNAPLAGKPPLRPEAAASAATPRPFDPAAVAAYPPAAADGSARDPAAILAGAPTPAPAPAPGVTVATAPSTASGAEPFVYFVQAGAFARAEEAEQQRARLAMLGLTARVSERDQHGRTVYRVRVGPFETRGEADGLQSRLQRSSIESQLVRAERQ